MCFKCLVNIMRQRAERNRNRDFAKKLQEPQTGKPAETTKSSENDPVK